MNFIEEGRWSNEYSIDLTRSKKGSHVAHKFDIESAPKKALVQKRTGKKGAVNESVKIGTCVVHRLPIHHYPSTVAVSSGNPDEVFAGFVFESNCSNYRMPLDEVVTTCGSFHIYTRHYDVESPFGLNKKVYAGPNGLITTGPGAEVGIVVSLPTVEDPFLGVMGQAWG